MAFQGWPAEALEFFAGLEADNSKAYWQEHKATYERAVRAPMDELLAELAPQFGEGRVFRPYRDVRFSRDKSPYKTNIAATLERGPYLSLSSQGLSAGAGFYTMARDQLDRYRRAVADDGAGEQLAKIVAIARKAGLEVSAYEELKTAPKGYPKDHPRIELLRGKGLITWRSWPVEAWLATPAVKRRIAEFWKQSGPLVAWLEQNVGESSLTSAV